MAEPAPDDYQGQYFRDQQKAKQAERKLTHKKIELCPICECLCYPSWPLNLKLVHVCQKDETIDWLDLFACIPWTSKESPK